MEIGLFVVIFLVQKRVLCRRRAAPDASNLRNHIVLDTKKDYANEEDTDYEHNGCPRDFVVVFASD